MLREIAALLAIRGENVFRVRAFENGADAIAGVPDLEDRVRNGTLTSLPGVGKALAEIVSEFVREGRSKAYDEITAETPATLVAVMKIPGLGPKRTATLFKELGITSLGELEYAVRENRLVTLPGFGLKTQEKILGGLAFLSGNAGRFRLFEALPFAEKLAAQLRTLPNVARLEIAGDLRRRLEIVTEAVFVVSCENPESVVSPPAAEGTLPVRLVAVRDDRFGTALLRETGTAAHLAALVERGLDLTFPAREEAEIYSRLGLPFIPPELRESGREVGYAAEGTLPQLVTESEIRGLFHLHTTWSDGRATLEELLRTVSALGYSYAGISDHSPSAAYAGGLTAERLVAQRREIDALRPRFPELTIFHGTESDIHSDGSLDFPEDALASLDFVIASVHGALRLSREEQTERLVRAVQNPRVTLLGHATARLLLSRKGIDVDLPRVLAAAGEAGTGVELNASPFRLDLDWRFGETARAAGVFTSINPDAHSLDDLGFVKWGVAMARKAGFSSGDVLNCGDAKTVGEKLAALRARA